MIKNMFMQQAIVLKKFEIITSEIIFSIHKKTLLFSFRKIFMSFPSIILLNFFFLLWKDFANFHKSFFVAFLIFLVIFSWWILRHYYIWKKNQHYFRIVSTLNVMTPTQSRSFVYQTILHQKSLHQNHPKKFLYHH